MDTMKNAMKWVYTHTINTNEGIIVSTERPVLYPEVTGYYIPSLLNAGEERLAISFAKKMCAIRCPLLFSNCRVLQC